MEGINICLVLLAVFCISGIGSGYTRPYIYYVDNAEDEMFRVAVSGGQPERLNISRMTPMDWPYAIAHNPVSDCLYWSELAAGKEGIGRFCLQNKSASFLSMPGIAINGIAVDPMSGLLFITDHLLDSILAVNFANSSTSTVVSGGMKGPLGIAVDVAKGRDLPALHRVMLNNRTALFEKVTTHFEVSDRIVLLRSCDIGGMWRTRLTEVCHTAYEESHENATYRIEINLTEAMFDAFLARLPDVLRLCEDVVEYEMEKPTFPIYQCISIEHPEKKELYLTEEEAKQDRNRNVISHQLFQILLELERDAIRHRGMLQPQWGLTDDNPIDVVNTNVPYHIDLQGITPTHVLYEMQAVRPTQDELCRHFAMTLYRKEILHYGNGNLPQYTVEDGLKAQESIMRRWHNFQALCTDVLLQLGYVLYAPSENYIRDLLSDVSPDAPYHMAMNKLNFKNCLTEIDSVKEMVLNCIYDRFSPLYFKEKKKRD